MGNCNIVKRVTMIKQLICCMIVAGFVSAQTWPAFQTTFGSFWSQPRTRSEAESNGWVLVSSCDPDKYLGHRFVNPEDDSIVLIYDDAGYIAGSQSVVLEQFVDPTAMAKQPAYQMDSWFDTPAYMTAIYFVDPEIICNGGRSQAQFDSQGTGDRLVVQIGATATSDNLLPLPLTKDAALADPAWYDHYCFIGMGDHFLQFDYSPDQDCQTVLPLQLLFDDNYDGVLAGFVWQHMAYLTSNGWEHPDRMAVGAIIDRPPTCVWDAVDTTGLSTMHHYFWNYPLLIMCPFNKEQTYKRLLTSLKQM